MTDIIQLKLIFKKNNSNSNTKKGINVPLESVCDALEGIIIEDNPQKNKTTYMLLY